MRAATAADAVHGVEPARVAAPADAAECAALLADCSARGWSVEIAGGRSGRGAGRPPERVDVLLSTERMRGVTEYEPDDLTIGVGAGTPLGELRAHVAQHRQRVPLDASDEATVGGVLARAAAGAMRRSWATPRRQTLGIELVTGDGRVLRVGGRVVKNVAGYDLNKLIVGSAGTLGVITRAHLRLLPEPVSAATLVLEAGEADALCAAARALLREPAQPAALELVGAPWRLVARYEGAGELVDSARAAVARVAAATPGVRVEAGGRVDAGAADDALERLAAQERAAEVVIRVADLPDRLAATLARARELAGAAAAGSSAGAADSIAAAAGSLAAHAGDGIVRVLLGRDAAVAPLAAAIERARAGFGGTIVVERGTPELMRAVDPWGALAPPVLELARALRRQFDPAGILQRGRWLA